MAALGPKLEAVLERGAAAKIDGLSGSCVARPEEDPIVIGTLVARRFGLVRRRGDSLETTRWIRR